MITGIIKTVLYFSSRNVQSAFCELEVITNTLFILILHTTPASQGTPLLAPRSSCAIVDHQLAAVVETLQRTVSEWRVATRTCSFEKVEEAQRHSAASVGIGRYLEEVGDDFLRVGLEGAVDKQKLKNVPGESWC
jgi:hypothetical protein